jgi:acyl dehydratase
MPSSNSDKVAVGDDIPVLVVEPISRTTLALYAGASGDHNPIHIDIDFARKAGMEDVFCHGMLIMAYLGRAITNWVPLSALRQYKTRFRAISHVGDQITCQGTVTEVFYVNGEKRARLGIQAANQDGNIKLLGEAIVALPE